METMEATEDAAWRRLIADQKPVDVVGRSAGLPLVRAEPRQAIRAIVVDAADRILLVRFDNPDTGEVFWATPGGALESGEGDEEALRRELREETGLAGFEWGPVVWRRRHVFPWFGRTLDQRESFVLLRVPAFEPRPELGVEGLAAEGVHELRWWTVEEIEASPASFAPSRLAALVRELLSVGPPSEPIDAGV